MLTKNILLIFLTISVFAFKVNADCQTECNKHISKLPKIKDIKVGSTDNTGDDLERSLDVTVTLDLDSFNLTEVTQEEKIKALGLTVFGGSEKPAAPFNISRDLLDIAPFYVRDDTLKTFDELTKITGYAHNESKKELKVKMRMTSWSLYLPQLSDWKYKIIPSVWCEEASTKCSALNEDKGKDMDKGPMRGEVFSKSMKMEISSATYFEKENKLTVEWNDVKTLSANPLKDETQIVLDPKPSDNKCDNKDFVGGYFLNILGPEGISKSYMPKKSTRPIFYSHKIDLSPLVAAEPVDKCTNKRTFKKNDFEDAVKKAIVSPEQNCPKILNQFFNKDRLPNGMQSMRRVYVSLTYCACKKTSKKSTTSTTTTTTTTTGNDDTVVEEPICTQPAEKEIGIYDSSEFGSCPTKVPLTITSSRQST